MFNQKEYMRNYMPNYWRTHPAKYKKHKAQMTKQIKKIRHNQKILALKLIGDKCVICGSIKHLCFHEIHGIPHKNTQSYFYLKHPENFVTLCNLHHKLIHMLGEMSYKEAFKILLLVEQLQKCLNWA
jgi:hypothetical protein